MEALGTLTVEVVTVVLFLLGLRWMPTRVETVDPHQGVLDWSRRVRDLTLAVLVGLALAALSYALLTRHAPMSISPFFIEKALPEGGGTNIVNVMLVDFRAFDTLGEITVLGVAGLVIHALLRQLRDAVGRRHVLVGERATRRFPKSALITPDVADAEIK